MSFGSSYQQSPMSAPCRAKSAQLQVSFLGLLILNLTQASYGPTLARSSLVKMPISLRLFSVLFPMLIRAVKSDI